MITISYKASNYLFLQITSRVHHWITSAPSCYIFLVVAFTFSTLASGFLYSQQVYYVSQC
ncbi:hypothetical protein BX661DRAFT_184551 [Kickxella alabastrina]|uniref:uncharacterized protein n=1 Tax=Kickxella alabastrina TaxID=61397 RepID=UPI00221FE433|nr:uncharacterized protein BX661DRAFT_184551 [Kickxella alabastrina]KAI7825437.1 hypothetical protein BX661DRAFT_184551 [Kickxella alabastrina]